MLTRPRGTVALLAMAAATCLGSDPNALVVHECGTFTSFQDEHGNAIGGINVDDNPPPNPVYNTAAALFLPGDKRSQTDPRCHPDVTMRLDGSTIYFYPPENFRSHFEATVKVWNAGWITQFYPKANIHADGMDEDGFGDLRWSLGSKCEWKDLVALTERVELSSPNSRVPKEFRLTDPATIECNGEQQKFLFYRGVANGEAPLRVIRDGPEFRITKADNDIADLWLIDVGRDGLVAFRVLHPFNQAPAFVLKTDAQFAPGDYSKSAAAELREALHKALTDKGLFDEEADALLDNGPVSSIKNPGMRFFFLVPAKWGGAVRPLDVWIRNRNGYGKDVSIPVELTRVTIGRIEIVTPEQRRLLGQIAAGGPDTQSKQLKSPASLSEERWKQLNQLYAQLGQFRNALVLNERKRNSSPILDQFIQRFGLEAYAPPPLGFSSERARKLR